MAILWMDGCDTYTAVADVALRYINTTTGLSHLSTAGGRFGGGCMGCSYTSSNIGGGYLGPAIIPHTATAVIAGGSHIPPASGGTYPCLVFGNTLGGSGTNELSLYYDAGLFKLYRGYGTTLLATTTGFYAPGLYHHIEAKAVIHDTTGSCEVRIDGVTAITVSSVDTRASTTGTAGVDRIGFVGSGTTVSSGGAWDDVYVLDTTGSVANNFLGDVRINTLAPTSDAAVQFTKSTGASNFSCVDEGRMNSDTDYVESSTVGHIDRYGFADLAAAVATVYGVQPIVWCRKTDATVRTMRTKLVSGATTSDGSSFALTTGYLPMVSTYTLDPNTSAQWTVSNANAATAGFEVLT